MCGSEGTSEELDADERKVFLHREGFCFRVEMFNGGIPRQPVAMRRAEFLMIWSVLMFEDEVLGNQMRAA